MQQKKKSHPYKHYNQNGFHIDTIQLQPKGIHGSDDEHPQPVFLAFIDDTNDADISTILMQHNNKINTKVMS